jgi:hypothetical protein
MGLPIPFPSGELIQRKTSSGYTRDLLIPSSFDYDVFEDKFWGDTFRDEYPAGKTNGTSAAVTFAEHNTNGFLSLVSGTADDGYAGQGLGLNFTGDRGVLFEAILEMPGTITTMKWECGLSDADDDAGAVNVKATPSVTATDFAVFCFDTDDDTNIAFISAIGGDGGKVATQDIRTLVASETLRLAVRVETDSIAAYINGVQVAGGTHQIQGGNKITPWAFVQARTGSASRTVKLHKWRCTQPAY